jgi:ATP-dependent RNA helicase RhlE
MSFSTFGLSESTMRAVADAGYSVPTEIQRKAIPLALQGKDSIGCAPTGTGKTAAFVLPMLDILARSKRIGHLPRSLVLTPTRELAQQVEDAVKTYGKFAHVKPVSIYGGVGINGQIQSLRHGVDIVVATPGRLLDHMERRTIDLSAIQILVLDEADRMYDMGFIHDVRRIISHVPKNRQTLLFSATMSREIRSLIAEIQKSPHQIDIGVPYTPVETVDQHFYTASQQTKMDLLVHVLRSEEPESMLVFSRTKHGADRIAQRLSRSGFHSAAIHADRTQSQRQQALDGFKQRRHRILVATDLAARGIDVDGISHVVNYDTPVFPEDYIHRIGRTGRAEAKGKALTFVSNDEEKFLRRIESLTSKRFELKRYPGFTYAPEHRTGRERIEPQGPQFGRRGRPYQRELRFA